MKRVSTAPASSPNPASLLVLGHHDLDGMVSAAIAGAFLREWFPHAALRFGTVDFHLKENWGKFWEALGTAECKWRPEEQAPKPEGLAVVDFLYTEVPGDVFLLQADHHHNTFDVPGQSRDHLQASFQARERLGSPVFHDAKQGSCARLLIETLLERYGWVAPASLREAARVAHVVDTAGYRTAVEALDMEQEGPALDLLSLALSERAAADAVERLANGATLREALIEPNQEKWEQMKEGFERDVSAYHNSVEHHESGLGVWDFTEVDGEAPNRVKFAEYQDPAVQYAVQLHLKSLSDGSFLVAGVLGRSPWSRPLERDLAPPNLAKIAQSLAGGGGHPFAAGFRAHAPTREGAVAQARNAVSAMMPFLRPLPISHEMADRSAVPSLSSQTPVSPAPSTARATARL